MKKNLPAQITLSVILSFLFAVLHIALAWDSFFIIQYIKPIGIIFVKGLQSMAMPLIATSLIVGVNSVQDKTKISKIGGQTVLLYGGSTVLSACFGLLVGNLIKPGKKLSQGLIQHILDQHSLPDTITVQKNNWIQSLASSFPENIFKAFTDNNNLLFIVFLSLVFGVLLLDVASKKRTIILTFCDACNEVFTRIAQLFMQLAPFFLFCLITPVLVEVSDGNFVNMGEYIIGVAWYTGLTIVVLLFMAFLVYPVAVAYFTSISWRDFVKTMRPAQLAAFSSSSSSVALPITMQQVHSLGVSQHISAFVLPLGATVNMNGTAMYQSIAIVFITQAFGIDLSIQEQCMIVGYITFAAVGAAGVPGSSLSSTALLITMLGLPAQAIALIMPPERILDMLRTTINMTGDAAVAVYINHTEAKNKIMDEKTNHLDTPS